MKSNLLAISFCLWVTSCASYQIPSLEVTLDASHAMVAGTKVKMSKINPYLRRATWSDARQPFTVWKFWDEVRMENGTVLQIVNQGPSFSSFRIVGIEGEYYIRPEDRANFDSAWRGRASD